MIIALIILIFSIIASLWNQANNNDKNIRHISTFAYLLLTAISFWLMLAHIVPVVFFMITLFSPVYAAILSLIYTSVQALFKLLKSPSPTQRIKTNSHQPTRKKTFRKPRSGSNTFTPTQHDQFTDSQHLYPPTGLNALKNDIVLLGKRLRKIETRFASVKNQAQQLGQLTANKRNKAIQNHQNQLQNIEVKIKGLFALYLDNLNQIERSLDLTPAYAGFYTQPKTQLDEQITKLNLLHDEAIDFMAHLKQQVIKLPLKPKTRQKYHQQQFDKLDQNQKAATLQLWNKYQKKGNDYHLWHSFDPRHQDTFWQQYEALLALAKTSHVVGFVGVGKKTA